jgi:hypothetical protein
MTFPRQRHDRRRGRDGGQPARDPVRQLHVHPDQTSLLAVGEARNNITL